MALWYRRLHILATQELFSTPKSEKFFTMMQCIPVNKQNFNYSTFKQVEYWLDRNSIVAIFPEGTVNENKDLTNTCGKIVLQNTTIILQSTTTV